jgi:uncharacterized protein involved in exopolysaccharide biosynthesis
VNDNKADVALIDLFEMWKAIWVSKYYIIAFTFFVSALSVLYAVSLPNKYKAEILIAHANNGDASALGGMASQLGGIASLAGINIGADSNDSLVNLKILQSKMFLFEFINKHKLKVPLIAAVGWDEKSNQLILDETKYDSQSKKWIRVTDDPTKVIPSDFEAYEAFIDLIKVEEDKNNGLVSISLEFFDPNLTKTWVTLLVDDLNYRMKMLEIKEKRKSIEFLNLQLNKTNVVEMQNVFYQIIEEQTKSMLLAEVQKDFVFKIIDNAIVPENKSSPKRAVICILGTMTGAIFSIFVALLIFYIKKFRVDANHS